MAKLIDKTYGYALFELALERGKVDEYFEESKILLEVLLENSDYIKLLNHPKISKEEKEKVTETIFAGKLSDDLTGIIMLMIKKDRQSKLLETISYFVEYVKEYKKIGKATVTTAIELTDSKKDEIVKKLIATTDYVAFETSFIVDKDIIGGMIIRIGDRVVDSSIRTKIYNISKELYNIQLS